MLKSNKNNARNKISQCVEFRSKKETAIRGNIDGEKTWNNLDQRVEENIPRGRVHDRDAIVLRVQILERNRETNRARVEPGENEERGS